MVISEWIPVTERMPSKGEAVLVANRCWVNYEESCPGEWRQHVYITVWSDECVGSSITHWMPKPKPPQIK